jgi:hypothetical protein
VAGELVGNDGDEGGTGEEGMGGDCVGSSCRGLSLSHLMAGSACFGIMRSRDLAEWSRHITVAQFIKYFLSLIYLNFL